MLLSLLCNSLAGVNGFWLNLKPGLGGQGCLAGHGGAAVQDLLSLGSWRHPGSD